jgi:hypothetical protein
MVGWENGQGGYGQCCRAYWGLEVGLWKGLKRFQVFWKFIPDDLVTHKNTLLF